MEEPRIRMSGKRFGSEPALIFSMIRKLGSMVDKALAILVVLIFFNSSPFTVTAEPVNPSLPVTTTSSNSVSASSRTTRKGCTFPFSILTGISLEFIPTKENSREIPGVSVISRLNLPSISVATPIVVPFTTTVTPGSTPPLESTTTPSSLINFWGAAISAPACFL